MSTTGAPLADPVEEGRRVAERARAEGLEFRLVGGVGIALRCPSSSSAPLRRAHGDLDFVGHAADRKSLTPLLSELGYSPDATFNALHGARRLLFTDGASGRQLDVFLDRAQLCHTIDLSRRLGGEELTLPLADLLLMKLQVVETNHKDFVDILSLLVDWPLTPNDSGIELPYLAGLAAGDWGLWRTVTLVAERSVSFARELAGFDRQAVVERRVSELVHALDEVPKTRRWRLRAQIGERKRWYELPEEKGSPAQLDGLA